MFDTTHRDEIDIFESFFNKKYTLNETGKNCHIQFIRQIFRIIFGPHGSVWGEVRLRGEQQGKTQ